MLSMQGHQVIAELRDDTVVRGLLETSDACMKYACVQLASIGEALSTDVALIRCCDLMQLDNAKRCGSKGCGVQLHTTMIATPFFPHCSCGRAQE